MRVELNVETLIHVALLPLCANMQRKAITICWIPVLGCKDYKYLYKSLKGSKFWL